MYVDLNQYLELSQPTVSCCPWCPGGWWTVLGLNIASGEKEEGNNKNKCLLWKLTTNTTPYTSIYYQTLHESRTLLMTLNTRLCWDCRASQNRSVLLTGGISMVWKSTHTSAIFCLILFFTLFFPASHVSCHLWLSYLVFLAWTCMVNVGIPISLKYWMVCWGRVSNTLWLLWGVQKHRQSADYISVEKWSE